MGLARLREPDECGISGGELVTFMSDSVAARLDSNDFMDSLAFLCSELSPLATVALMKCNNPFASFWVGLARLRDECGISGGELVTFMSDSVAARLDSNDFMDGLAFLCSELSPLATVALMKCNNPFASRLTPSFSRSVVSIVRHFGLHGLAGAPTLKEIVGKSPLIGKMPELEARVLSLNTRVLSRLMSFCNRFAGHMRTSARWHLHSPTMLSDMSHM